MNIKGEEVILRAVEEKDLWNLHIWANAPDLQDAIGNIHFPSNMEYQMEWFSKLKDDNCNLKLAVSLPEGQIAGIPGDTIIGLTSIINIDWRNRHAWHGLMMSPEYSGLGYGFDALIATMHYAFNELGLERLDGQMIEYNEKSIEFYKKAGWKIEGTRRNYWFRHGIFYDSIIVGVTREDYEDYLGVARNE